MIRRISSWKKKEVPENKQNRYTFDANVSYFNIFISFVFIVYCLLMTVIYKLLRCSYLFLFVCFHYSCHSFFFFCVCHGQLLLDLYAKFRWLISRVQLSFQINQLMYFADWRIAEETRRYSQREFNLHGHRVVTEPQRSVHFRVVT